MYTHSNSKIGDVVRLLSGGPKMTVTKHFNTTVAQVSWFDGDYLYRELVPYKSLLKVDSSSQ